MICIGTQSWPSLPFWHCSVSSSCPLEPWRKVLRQCGPLWCCLCWALVEPWLWENFITPWRLDFSWDQLLQCRNSFLCSFWCKCNVGRKEHDKCMRKRYIKSSYSLIWFLTLTISLSLWYIHFDSYSGYGHDQRLLKMSGKEETLMACFALLQCVLLGSFAAILGAHRSEILDKPRPDQEHDQRYEPPQA